MSSARIDRPLAASPSSPSSASLAETAGDRGRVLVAPARVRQTEPAPTPFRSVLAGGTSALLTGAEVASRVLAGPVLAAAVHQASSGVRAGVVDGIAAGATGRAPGSVTVAATAPGSTGDSYLDNVREMQRESQLFNVQLLQLQEEVQAENRRFTTLSNVCRARHDTASACVKNIH